MSNVRDGNATRRDLIHGPKSPPTPSSKPPPTNPRFRANTLPMGAACGKKREMFAYLTIANHSEHTNREI